HLLCRQMGRAGENRQRQPLPGRLLGFGQRALAVAEIAEALLPVERHRIKDRCGDPILSETSPNPLSRADAHDELVIDMLPPGSCMRQDETPRTLGVAEQM